LGTEKETSSHGRSSLSPLALLGILAFGSILITMGSKRWKKRGHKSTQKPRNQQLNTISPQGHSASPDGNAQENTALHANLIPAPEHATETTHCRPDQTPIAKWILETLAVGVGIVVAIIYGKQLGQMLEANNLAQKTFEVSQQASVTIGNKDGVVAEFRSSHNRQVQDGLVIYFQNSGHMPAKLNWGVNNWFIEHPIQQLPDAIQFEPMRRTRNKKTGDITDNSSTDGSIGGEAVREVAVGYLQAGFVDYLNKTNRPFKLNGTYEYCDELGRYACREFSLEYRRLPFGTFRIIWDNACIERAWLGKTQPGPDEEALPVCVPRNAPAFPHREESKQ
jgi:hypothetical protein